MAGVNRAEAIIGGLPNGYYVTKSSLLWCARADHGASFDGAFVGMEPD
jgi:hypothetical protein